MYDDLKVGGILNSYSFPYKENPAFLQSVGAAHLVLFVSHNGAIFEANPSPTIVRPTNLQRFILPLNLRVFVLT